MTEDGHEPTRGAVDFGPFETGVNAALIALLMHLIAPASGNVRRTDADWPALDPYRIGPPSQSGWPIHLAYGLLVALAVGSLVGGAHWAVERPIGGRRARRLLGWGFLLLAAAAGFFAPLFLHRFPRVPDRPPAATAGPNTGDHGPGR